MTIPAVAALLNSIEANAKEWDSIVTIGRTHMQDADFAHARRHRRRYGHKFGTGFAEAAAVQIANHTGLPFVTAPNKFAVQGAHDVLVQLSGTLLTLVVSLYKIGNDIRLMSCGPPGEICRADDVAVGFGRAGGYLEMNVYQPLLIYNIAHSITGDRQLHELLPVPGGRYAAQPEENQRVRRQLADAGDGTVSVIGYDKASKIAHYANDHDLTLKAAALKLGLVSDAEFDRIVDPSKTVRPYDAGAA